MGTDGIYSAISKPTLDACLVGQFTGATPLSSRYSGDLPVVQLLDLTVSYRRHPALHHISGQFARGSLTAVIGPNGAGKSTLLKSIAGMLPTEGQVKALAGHRQAALAVNTPDQHLAYLPQQNEMDRSFPINVFDCVSLGLWSQTGAFRGLTDGMLARVDAALQSMGLQGFERRPVGTLSSGQLQRALFARLIVQDAPLILLDEPFNAVDSKTAAALLALVLEWQREGRTVVAALHDDALVREHFPQALLLAHECIAWGPTKDVLTESNVQRTRNMVEAWDETAALCGRDGQLNGVGFDDLLARRLNLLEQA